MMLLSTKNLSVIEFKKKYPRLYRKIITTYGGRDNVFDVAAAIELWGRGEPPPQCEICQKHLSITKSYRERVSRYRCSKHINTDALVSKSQIEEVLPNNVSLSANTAEKFPPTTELTLVCAFHGQYNQLANYVLKGGQCQKCYHESRKPRISFKEWALHSAKIHNNKYNYTNAKFKSVGDNITIACPVHGEFVQNAGSHMRGHGCKECAIDTITSKATLDTTEFISRAMATHGDTYIYEQTEYRNSRSEVVIACKKHGGFSQIAYYHLNGNGCPTCGVENTTTKSAAEYEIINFLQSNGIANIQHSWRGLGFELDIYLPDYDLAIEYNGVYWHSSGNRSDDAKKSSMHLIKTEKCESAGISLLHILDAEWNDPVKQDIWKSTILHKLGKSRQKIYARNCSIVLVQDKVAKKFFIENHLQGHAYSALNIGLVYNNQLVSLGAFAKSRFSKKENAYEIIRFASLTNTSVVGGFQKIIKEFARTYSGILISYANRRWSRGQVYEKSNFVLESISGPCYYYTNCKTIWHRSIFQKHKLSGQLPNFDPKKTEVENMYNNKYRRIWDCGHKKYRMIL